MQTSRLSNLLRAYRDAPDEFRATSYWSSYEKDILKAISSMDKNQLRSGKYPILATFGFNDVVYTYHPHAPRRSRITRKFVRNFLIRDREILPYDLSIADIRQMAYRHCTLQGHLSGAAPIGNIEMSDFGNPADLFAIDGKKYSMAFLSYYLRYCFVHRQIPLRGNETIVELGSGSGHQVEILKKLYPKLTVLCFDLPAQIFLCETYLSEALGEENVVGTEETLRWTDLSGLKKGHVHFLGNWQIPLLKDVRFDIFWNAASFGEMEPEIVKNYLSYVKGIAMWIYLLQARHGKARVKTPITFDDYNKLLSGYVLQGQGDVYQAHKRLTEAGGYFEGIWLDRKADR